MFCRGFCNINFASVFLLGRFLWEIQAMEVIAFHAWNFAMDTANFATILTTSMGRPLHNFMRKTPDGRNSL